MRSTASSRPDWRASACSLPAKRATPERGPCETEEVEPCSLIATRLPACYANLPIRVAEDAEIKLVSLACAVTVEQRQNFDR